MAYDLETAERHVREGAERIAQQRRRIAYRECHGHSHAAQERSRELLQVFEQAQANHEAYLARLQARQR